MEVQPVRWEGGVKWIYLWQRMGFFLPPWLRFIFIPKILTLTDIKLQLEFPRLGDEKSFVILGLLRKRLRQQWTKATHICA
jgi:hypothetical protein